MEKISTLFNKLKRRERILIFISFFLLILIGIYSLIVNPLFSSLEGGEEQLKSGHALLKRYYRHLGSEEIYKSKLEAYNNAFTSLRTLFLNAETEELATAELQKTVKNIATRNGLTVIRSTAMAREILNEEPRLILISGYFEFGDVDKVKKINAFLYDVEHNNETIFFIDDFRIRGAGSDTSKGISISANLTAVAKIEKR